MFYRLMGATIKLDSLRGGPLLHQMLRSMADKSRNPDDQLPLIQMYSGHAHTIIFHLQTLWVYEDHIPPYASAVVHELHQLNSTWHVKTIYTNSTDTFGPTFTVLTVPGCQELCPLDKLFGLMKPLMPIDYRKQCYVGVAGTTLGETVAVAMAVVVLVMAVCCMIAVCCHNCARSRQTE